MKYVGAHVSIAGGVENAPLNAAAIGAKGFAMFTKNQRQWQASPLTEESIAAFKENCAKNGYTADAILPHDGYLINLAQPDPEKLLQSRESFLGEMRRCEALGLKYLNFHPGSHLKVLTIDEALKRVAESLEWCLDQTESVQAVIENTAGQGSYLGSSFEELAKLVELTNRPGRVGVCLDTCHAFAAGYDISTDEGYAAVMEEFGRKIGFDLLRGMHLNDSKSKLAGHLDRHDSLGKGFLGWKVFRNIMQDPRIDNIPLVLETVDPELWPEEIAALCQFAE